MARASLLCRSVAARTTKRFSVAAMALCHEQTVQPTARGQDSRGLNLARCYMKSARPLLTASPHRLSTRSLLRENFNSESSILSRKKRTHEICSRKVVELISNALPFGSPVVWRAECKSNNAIDYAKFRSRSHDAVIRAYDEAEVRRCPPGYHRLPWVQGF